MAEIKRYKRIEYKFCTLISRVQNIFLKNSPNNPEAESFCKENKHSSNQKYQSVVSNWFDGYQP